MQLKKEILTHSGRPPKITFWLIMLLIHTVRLSHHELDLNSIVDTFVAVNEDGIVVGSFYVKPNYPDRCAHICNGGFLVNKHYRGRGIGKFLGEALIDHCINTVLILPIVKRL